MLQIHNLSLSFGGLAALKDVALIVEQNIIFGLIGPNGAGKTSLFNVISGVYKPSKGEIKFSDENLRGLKTHELVKKGISRTFQNIRIFKGLSVLENILIALDSNPASPQSSLFSALLRNKDFREKEQQKRREALEYLKIFELEGRENEAADALPYGLQRHLEMARALATGAKLLLLDEPAAGLNASETKELEVLLRKVRGEHNLTILMIEHDMKLVMNVCERVAVLNFGQKIAEGTPSEIKNNELVLEAYLGPHKS